MASMLISSLIPLLQQPGLMVEMEEEYQKLLDFFMITQPVLADAELRAEGDPNVRTWLVDLNALVYDADDIVDDFRYVKIQAEAEAEGCQNGDKVRAGLFSRFNISCINRPFLNKGASGPLQGIQNRIGPLVKKIDGLAQRMRDLNFQPGHEQNLIASPERPQNLVFSIPTEMVGRDEEKEAIIKYILDLSIEETKAVTIVGPQGIGKTALARSVCNDARISGSFVHVLWVKVGSEFNIGKIRKSMINQVIGKDCYIPEDDTYLLELRLLQELGMMKSFLVVLDDVRINKEALMEKSDQLISLVFGRCGRLIVTSCFYEVVQMFERTSLRNEHYVLKPLLPEDGLNLFCKKAFFGDVKEARPEILEMWRKIMIKCGGSPLALNMIGALMRFKNEPAEWQWIINRLGNDANFNNRDGLTTAEFQKWRGLINQFENFFNDTDVRGAPVTLKWLGIMSQLENLWDDIWINDATIGPERWRRVINQVENFLNGIDDEQITSVITSVHEKWYVIVDQLETFFEDNGAKVESVELKWRGIRHQLSNLIVDSMFNHATVSPERCEGLLNQMNNFFNEIDGDAVTVGPEEWRRVCQGVIKDLEKRNVDSDGATTDEPEKWRGIINQLKDIFGYHKPDDVATIDTIINVCYDDLCSQVKQCFSFCSLFPKGHYMDKEVLIQLWMANGLLLHSDGSTVSLEERGNIVFVELTSRHFFELVKPVHEDHLYGNKHGYQSSVTCKMLDIIHERAVIAAREFSQQIPKLLSIPRDPFIDIPVLLKANRAVRMLLSPNDPFIISVNCSAVPEANSLRGLHLHSALFERDLLELKYMRHLRYLDLSRSRIKILPEATSSLYFLETLNLSKCLLLYQLPKNMKYMKSLRHFYIHKCPKLKKMPARFRQLNNLQTLTTYIVGEKNAGTDIDEIEELHLYGLLELFDLSKVQDPAIAKKANLVLKTNLDRLTLCWGRDQLVMPKENNDLKVLEALQPHAQLKVLKVQQYGGREFATWLADPVVGGSVNLVELHLIGCPQCETLPALWMLSSLTVLYLKHMPRLTCISRTDEKTSTKLIFPSLKRLVLVGLKRLGRWNEGGAMHSNLKTSFEELEFPVLDEVQITGCPNLKTMPRCPQLKHISASIENYWLLLSVRNVIEQPGSLVKEVNIAKACNAHNEPFPTWDANKWNLSNGSSIRILRLDSTNSLFEPTTLPHSLLDVWDTFLAVEYLHISNCKTLNCWPLEFQELIFLRHLSIRMCPNLTGIVSPGDERYSKLTRSTLQKLEFYECNSLKQVPICSGLRFLELDECPEFESFSCIPTVEYLYLSCTSWTSLPSRLERVETLKTLWVSECHCLRSLPEELVRMDHLDTLVINECPMVKKLPSGLDTMLSPPKKLQILMCPDLEKFS